LLRAHELRIAHARQIVGQRLAAALGACVLGDGDRGILRRLCCRLEAGAVADVIGQIGSIAHGQRG
jgi:hypothetical protein